MPEWSPLFGHLLYLLPIIKRFPKNSQQPYVIGEVSKRFDESSDGLFYLDSWPAGNPLVVVTSPSLAVQACQEHDLSKPSLLVPFFHPLVGGENLFTWNGPEWKRSRGLFNSGFSSSYLSTQIGHIVEEATIYVDILREHARKGDMFSLDNMTLWFTLDIIGALTL